MKYYAILALAMAALLISCGDPDEEQVWDDGSTLWVAGTYADTALSWSPYGDILLFSTWAEGSSRLFFTDGINAPSERTFTGMDEYVGPYGAWSDENLRIVYTAMNSDSIRGQIRSIAGNDIYVTVHVQDSLPNAFPTYNAEGDTILYCGRATGSWQFYKIPFNFTPDSEGSPLYVTGFPEGDMLRPSYSPDSGTWLLFQHRASASDDWDIMIARPDGTDQRVLAQSSADDLHPTWGPDENWIAFASDRSGDFEIYITNVDDDTLIQVTDDPGMDLYPAWNPDKEWIAFSSDRLSGNWNMDIFAIEEPELP